MRNYQDSNRARQRPTMAVTARQLAALQATWHRLDSEADERVQLPAGHTRLFTDQREIRLRWSLLKIGRNVTSWSELTLKEAEYLLDYLNSGTTKLDNAIRREFARIGVDDPVAWVAQFTSQGAHIMRGKRIWAFGGRGFNEFNRLDKISLMEVLTTRPAPLTQVR